MKNHNHKGAKDLMRADLSGRTIMGNLAGSIIRVGSMQLKMPILIMPAMAAMLIRIIAAAETVLLIREAETA